MEVQGELVTKMAQQQSASTIFARVLARSRGGALPLASNGLVHLSSGQGHTIGKEGLYPIFSGASMFDSIFVPVGGGLAACIIIGKLLPQ